ncbi:acyltransferase family protein [Cellulomonas sp. PhB150]|uniref:acyltransferase family protein n=1 Tax=Cellulomonas sp. PhB150 TaxID=2485188 RepID=UPI000F49B38D|nr:acyltransferase family protein [Cellulomonas sp. PhB150]ROS31419.1 peptidoglycan/LPS O-acetylase OafA/YrhL [Cellulomonas sp. PhB150]
MTVESRPRGGPDLDRAPGRERGTGPGRAPDADLASAASADAAHAHRRTGRIPGLDGLRALAVTAVIAYHLFPDQLPGGFLGVDVFFVVSGFLITTLLLREVRDGGRLQLARFWVRRARRLVPALLLVVAVSIPAAALADRDLLVGIGRQVLGALTFSTNWLAIGAGASYFDSTQPELFQTFWSLAIEEQFYLLWPLLLAVVLAVCRTWRVRARLALAGALASALLMALRYHPGDDPTRVYYGTDTHAFGLLLGASAAFAWAGRDELLPRRAWARWAGPAALALLGVLVVVMGADEAVAYRGGIFVASLLAVVAVVACTTPAAGSSGYVSALSVRPLVWVGERSYGLYLWHWPVILVVAAVAGDGTGTSSWWRTALLALALTVALSWASYRWVESPVRQLGARESARRARDACRGPARLPRVLAGLAVVVVLAAVVAVITAPDESRAQESVEAAQAQVDAQNAQAPTKPSPSSAPSKAPGAPVTGDQVVAFGDSVLSAAAPTLYDAFPGIRIDAKPIRKWIDATPIIEKAAAAGTLRPVVVLNFGTNGGFQFKGSEAAFEDILDAIGPDRRVVVVTINGISHWIPDANAELKKLAAAHPNVTVADWRGYVDDHAGLLHADRTHPNMKGVVAYAKVLRSAFADLPPA